MRANNKLYRVTRLIAHILKFRSIRKSDWGDYFELNQYDNNKTINRDISELKTLLYDVYGENLVYNRKENHYEI